MNEWLPRLPKKQSPKGRMFSGSVLPYHTQSHQRCWWLYVRLNGGIRHFRRLSFVLILVCRTQTTLFTFPQKKGKKKLPSLPKNCHRTPRPPMYFLYYERWRNYSSVMLFPYSWIMFYWGTLKYCNILVVRTENSCFDEGWPCKLLPRALFSEHASQDLGWTPQICLSQASGYSKAWKELLWPWWMGWS